MKGEERPGSRGGGGYRGESGVVGSSFNWSIQAPGDLVIKFHGPLADYLDPEKPGPQHNYNIVINA